MRSRVTRIETSSIPRMLLVALAVLVTAPAEAVEGEGYGFYRTVEGDVQLTTFEQEEPLDVEPNYPLLLGDRIWVAAAGRLEAVLPDQTVVRAAGNTDVYFEELALYAGEEESFGTTLRLLEGEIQVVIRDHEVEREPLRIDTNNATLYLQEAGTYRIYADSRQWTELVVREGFGEVALEEGSVVVRADEEAVVDGGPDARVKVYPAGALDALEAWGQDLEREASVAARESYVDEELRYSAAPLDRHGEWLPVASGYAWRPYGVASAWRPYTRGYWTHTPGGLYWVSGEPWGAVTAHYGSWSPHPHHGWLWHPGSLFAPAWVHWYWGSTHVGWIPSGYYSHHYRGRYGYGQGYHHAGLRFGTYGYSSGGWGLYGSWTFCPTRYFGWRSYHSTWRSGHEIARTARHDAPRGLITNHTGGLPRHSWSRPDEVVHHLSRGRGQIGSPLGDVTDFVARQPRLDGRIEQAVFAGPSDSGSPIRTARTSPSSLRSAPGRSLEIERSAIESERSRAVASDIRSPARRSIELESRAAEIERGLPARPERSRGRSLTFESSERRPSSSIRSSPGTTRVERSEPGSGRTTERIVRSVRPPSTDFRTGESLRTPTAIDLERRVSGAPSARSPMEYLRQTQSIGSGPSRLTSPTTEPSDGRVPVVRRVLDGVRSTTSSPPSRSIQQSPSSSQRPTVSRPSSSPSRGTSSTISRGSTSRPSSSSVRKPASSGKTSSKMRSSSRSRSSRSKGKPPSD